MRNSPVILFLNTSVLPAEMKVCRKGKYRMEGLLLKVEEAAEILQRERHYIYKMRKLGKLKGVRLMGRWMILSESVYALLRQREEDERKSAQE